MIALVAAFSLPFLFLLVRRPVLRRLALRNAARRPRETMLVILGSLLGTAIITGSLVVGDTLDASLRQEAQTQLGPVDELVQASSSEERAGIEDRLARLDQRSEDIDGVLALTVVPAAVSAGSDRSAVGRAEPTAEVVEVDFDAARRFGDDPSSTGIEGDVPGPGQAVLGEDLADELEVEAGDEVTAYAYGTEVRLGVDRVLPQRGVAGFYRGLGGDSLNLFVAPGAVSGLAEEAAGEASPPSALVAVSNTGGVLDGADRTEEVSAQIDDALGSSGRVSTIKEDTLTEAEEVGATFTELFGSIGFFSVLAAALLLVNIFVMLAQERKPEMGMLRAVGLRRASLVGAFSLEGWLYTVASSLLGAVLGVGLGRVVSGLAVDIFSGSGFGLDLTFAADAASIQQGFTIGFAIALVTVVLTSLNISRVNVIRAIRDLPEPSAARPRLRSLVAGALLSVVGGWLTVSGVSGEEPYTALIGPALLALGLVPLLGRALPRRGLVSAAAVVALAWAILAFGLLPDAFEDADIPIFVVQGVILVGAAVALVSQNQDLVGRGLRALGRGRSMAVRLGLAYPLARRFRTGMILSMYSLVVFTLAFIVVLSHLFSNQVDEFTADVAGGFDLTVSSNDANPVPVEGVAERPDVAGVAALADAGAEFRTPATGGEFDPWFVTGIDDAFVEGGPTDLAELGSFPDERSAYDAVLADPGMAIVSEFFLQGGGGPPDAPLEPGDEITWRDPASGRTRQLTLAAISSGSFGNDAAYVSNEALRDLYGPRVTANHLVVATEPGVDPGAVADDLDAAYLANGADAESFRSLVTTNLSSQTQFFRLMQGYLALGLVVGIAGLGVVMVRAVRERRRQVGVLRALGYQAASVRKAFTVESGFVAVEGIVIGVVLALVTAWRLVENGTFGELSYSLPWLDLTVLVVGTFLASLLATATPAHQAARIKPAVALRLAD